jgi:hypothetical protein
MRLQRGIDDSSTEYGFEVRPRWPLATLAESGRAEPMA